MKFFLSLAAVLAVTFSARADDALTEVNALRAARGLPAFTPDPGLTAAAEAAASYRAQYGIRGHVPGGSGDFQFLPAGCTATAAGCGALEASWGFQACCVYENHQYAGAATIVGANGLRYHHIFVSNRSFAGEVAVASSVGLVGSYANGPCGAMAAAPTVGMSTTVRHRERHVFRFHLRHRCR